LKHSALDDLISARIEGARQDPQIVLMVRRLARVISAPALIAMLGGLLATLLAARAGLSIGTLDALPGPPAQALGDLVQAGAVPSGQGAMSVGLLALAALPAITVLFILVHHLRARQWMEAGVAAGLFAVLALSAVVGH
jgi:hypothetical protein